MKAKNIHFEMLQKEFKGYMSDKTVKQGARINWSPNNIRSIIILPDTIIVLYYCGVRKNVLRINTDDLVNDIMAYNKGTKIKSPLDLLTNRKLYCLEELIIAKSLVQTLGWEYSFMKAIDLDMKKARLRTAGYLDVPIDFYGYSSEAQKIISTYTEAAVNTEDFLSSRVFGDHLQVASTVGNNTNWYEKWELRPGYYIPDEKGKGLEKYFERVKAKYTPVESTLEKEKVESSEAEKEESTEEKTELDYYRSAIEIDKELCSYFFVPYLLAKKSPSYSEEITKCDAAHTKETQLIKLDARLIAECAKGKKLEHLIKMYQKLGMLSMNPQEVVSGAEFAKSGFLRIADKIDEICCAIVLNCSSKGQALHASVAWYTFENEIKQSKLREMMVNKSHNFLDVPTLATKENIEGLLDYLKNIIGARL